MERRSLTLSQPELAADGLGFFRWGRIAGKVLVTNDAGDWAFLSEAEFDDLLGGRHRRRATRASTSCSARACCATGWTSTRSPPAWRSATATSAAAPHVHVVTLTRAASGPARTDSRRSPPAPT